MVRQSGEQQGDRRRYRTCRVGSLLGPVLDPSARARGFATASLLNEWSTIVGSSLAMRCQPLAVRFAPGSRKGGTLEIASGGGSALELQHAAPQIIERINGYFGFAVIARLLIRQRAAYRAWRVVDTRPQLRPLMPHEIQRLSATVASIEHDQLRRALAELGQSIHAAGPVSQP